MFYSSRRNTTSQITLSSESGENAPAHRAFFDHSSTSSLICRDNTKRVRRLGYVFTQITQNANSSFSVPNVGIRGTVGRHRSACSWGKPRFPKKPVPLGGNSSSATSAASLHPSQLENLGAAARVPNVGSCGKKALDCRLDLMAAGAR